MAREVTMQELTDWVEKNKHRTWSHDCDLPEGQILHTMEMKYIRFNLDTRDMKVFSVSIDGGERFKADFRQEFNGTILELLESQLGPIPHYCLEEKKR